jgi:NitT/TauT family transport system substrate-binding protein
MRKIVGVLLILALISTLGCISKPEGRAGEKVTIRIGHLGGVADPEVYAYYHGYYDDEGLNISWVSFRGGSSVVKAVIAGELDGGVIGSTPAIIRAVSKGTPLKIVAVGQIETKEKPGDLLVVKKDSGIEDVQGLRGKTIAVHRLGTTLDLILRVGLKQQGIDPLKDVTITQVPITDMPQALLRGDVDAAFVFPIVYPVLMDDVNVILTPGDVFPEGAPISVVFFTEEFMEQHPEEVKKFVRAYLRGIRWAYYNPDRTPEIVAKDTGFDLDTSRKIKLPAFNPSGKVSDASFELMIAAIKEYDPESLGRDISPRDLVDYSFIE